MQKASQTNFAVVYGISELKVCVCPTHTFYFHVSAVIHLFHKWPHSNVLSGKVFKDIDAITLSSTAKYVNMGSLSGFGLMATKLWLFQI